MPRLRTLGALALLAACRGGPAACETASCRQAAALSAWSEDPVKGAAAIEALPTEIERSAAVTRIMETDPSQVARLCAALPEGKLRVRCLRTADRPHLWEGRAKPVTTGLRSAGGPRSHRLAPEQARASAYANVAGDLGTCAKAADPHTCAWARATELAAEGDTRAAAARCNAIEVTRGQVALWQAECRFTAAEAAIRGKGAQGYAGAAELCLSAGRFQERCLIHLARDLAARTPAADRQAGPELRATVQAAEGIGRFWGTDGAGPKFVDHFWSLAMGYAFLRAEAVTGDLMDAVPAQVLPHIHAAAAWRLMELQPDADRSLEAWAQALDAALAKRAHRPPGEEPTVHMPGMGNLWHAGTDEDQSVQAVIYMGMGRRGTAEAAGLDRRISLLEAAARQSPPLVGLVAEGTRYPALPVRWTAERLQRVGRLRVDIKQGPGN